MNNVQVQVQFNRAMSAFVVAVETARNATIETLLALGIGDRTTAAPLVKGWAKDAGMTERTAYRWLAKLFPNEGGQRGPKRGSGRVDEVAALVKKFQKLTAAQKRRFLREVR